mmetsp:Transcript_27094/g.63959  ORF Transcript_27094/g.63959 Transcript_27094/m.63959 type:complete len:356 (+) Transcript_27094:210-1277(+)
MTVGVDFRPLTATGSIRASDLMHDRAMYNAMLDKQQQVRRAHAAEVREQIEDFEHKLGWKMRKHLGPSWSEQRALELEEERTMGLKRLAIPRPPSPVRHYDYTVHNPLAETHHEYDMMKFDENENTSSHHGSRPATSAEMGKRPYTSFSSPNNTRTATAMGASRPASRRLGFMKGSMEMWTPHSMLEPIFMPSSSTQRSVIATAHSLANRIPTGSSAKQRRWEDGPGRHFWEMQDRQLRGALQRNEGNKLRVAQAEGAQLQHRYEQSRGSAQRKKAQAFEEAQRRKEPFPRAKVFAEVRLMEQIKAEWEERENKRLHLGMDGTALEKEATAVMRETAEFEERLKGFIKSRNKARW